MNGCLSEEMSSSTGSPQGCVLSPLLYILYMEDWCSQHINRHILNFADDSAIVSLLHSDETDHDPVMNDFVFWCENAFLQLHVSKTKDRLINFRSKPCALRNTTIKGQVVEVVETYRYLGSLIANKLNFTSNTDNTFQKGQQRLFCLRKLAKFNVKKTLMILFHKSYIESFLTFSMMCWYGNLSVKAKTTLLKIVKVSSKILGVRLSSLTDPYNRQVVRQAKSILSVGAHPLHSELQFLPSGSHF